jgi:hypothetical protein
MLEFYTEFSASVTTSFGHEYTACSVASEHVYSYEHTAKCTNNIQLRVRNVDEYLVEIRERLE